MAKAVVKVAPKSKPAPKLPASLTAELERRRAGLARHMARAVVAVVKWDDSTGVPPQREAIAKACEAGLDLFLATAREARPATPEELRRVAQLGILQARSSQSVEPVLAAYRIAARVAWDAILRAWRGHPEATPEAIMVTANYVFAALDQVAAEVTKTYLHAREQHMQRGTRARARLFHALISDNFDSELELQKQALALNMPIAATGYIATVSKLTAQQSSLSEDERFAVLAKQGYPLPLVDVRAIGELARAHAVQEVEILPDGPIAVRADAPRFVETSPPFAHFVDRLAVDVRLSRFNERYGDLE